MGATNADAPSFQYFPRTEAPPFFASSLVSCFAKRLGDISTVDLTKGLTSDKVLATIRPELVEIGFDVEEGKSREQKIQRPVFFGEQGRPTLLYEIDAYHPEWRCGLEVEAGRAFMGNAFYRDLVQAMVMVQVDFLAIAVPLCYKFKSNNRESSSADYSNATKVAEALFGHSRFSLPYKLLVIGY